MNEMELEEPQQAQKQPTPTDEGKIEVTIRVKPRGREDILMPWQIDSQRISQLDKNTLKPIQNSTYSFDRVFGERETTQDIYDSFARPISLSVLSGINATICLYGQTSTGKTFTMSGTKENPGIVPLVINELFSRISGPEVRPENFFPNITNASRIDFCIRVSYVEIYNETINDLLVPSSSNLRILESDRGVVLECKEEVVSKAEQVLELIKKGDENRHIGATQMNERSSRSHTILRATIESTVSEDTDDDSSNEVDTNNGKIAHVAMLTLVDLAGSERLSHTGAEGVRKVEAGQINKSLLTLGTVIFKLSEGNSSHIPFRDSKLTRLLQPSLSGNARTGIICTVSLLQQHIEETISTLKFASRAKKIEVEPIVNEVLDTTTVIGNLKREIRLLKQKLNERDDTMSSKDRDKSVKELETLSRSIIATPARPRQQSKKVETTTSSSGANKTPISQKLNSCIPSFSSDCFRTPHKENQQENEIQQLRDELAEANRRTQEVETKAIKLEEELQQKQSELELFTRESQKKISELEESERGLTVSLEKANKRIQEVEEQNSAQRIEASRTCLEMEEKITKMQEEIEKLAHSLSEAEMLAKKADWDKDIAKKEFFKSQTEIDVLTHQLQEANQAISKLQTEIESLPATVPNSQVKQKASETIETRESPGRVSISLEDLTEEVRMTMETAGSKANGSVMDENISLRAELLKTKAKILVLETTLHIQPGTEPNHDVSILSEAVMKANDERYAAQAKLNESIKELVSTKKELRQLETDLESLKKLHETTESTLAQTRQQLQQLQQQQKEERETNSLSLSSSSRQRKEVKEPQPTLQQQQQHPKENEKLAVRLAELRDKMRQLMEEKTKWQAEKATLERESKALTKQRDSLEKEGERLRTALTLNKDPSSIHQIAALQKQIEKLAARESQIKSELETNKKKENEMELQASQANEENMKLREESVKMKEKLESTQTRITELENENKGKSQQIAQLELMLSTTIKKHEENEKKLSQQLTELSFALEEEKAKVNSLEKEKALNDENESNSEKVTKLEQELSIQLDRVRELESEIARIQKQGQIEGSEQVNQIKQLVEDNKKLKEELKILEKQQSEQIKNLQQQIAQVEGQYASTGSQLEQAEIQMETLKKESESMKELIVQKMKEENEAAIRQIEADYTERVQDLEIQRDDLIEENLHIRKDLSKITELTRIISEIQEAREVDQRKWRSEKAKSDSDIRSFKQYIQVLEEQSAQLQNELDSIHSSKENVTPKKIQS